MTTGDTFFNSQPVKMNPALGVGTITGTYAPQRQAEMWDYPEYRVTVHKARNGFVVRVAFFNINNQSEVPQVEMWVGRDGDNPQELIAAAIAAHTLDRR